MDLFWLPRRCRGCGAPLETGLLCLECSARFRGVGSEGSGGCALCGQVRLGEDRLCVDCAARDWSFPCLDGLFGYQEPAGELLRLYKLGGRSELASLWYERAAARLVPAGPLVPVPPLRRHLWKRGWDPVETLVRGMGAASGQPVWRVLRRRPSASQKSLDRAGRAENARRSYGLAGGAGRLRGQLVWLVDDVVTTGATVEACSRLLLEAGAREVRVFCLGLH